VSLDSVAGILNLTPRTLQRRLSEQDESFKGLLDKVRKELALTYIAQPFIDLAELAYLLGFSDQTAFQRAFKKWTGTTPGKFRRG
jgi:AraC-like DNA-binding protein